MADRKKFKQAQECARGASAGVDRKIEELGRHAVKLDVTLTRIQDLFERIGGKPDEYEKAYKQIKGSHANWKLAAEKIEKEYDNLGVATGCGSAATVAGIGLATLGPTAAMGVATTFGVASTGTAISALSGAAATNAALAWLGGGALAAGGGGMVAGKALLLLAGPVGWSVAAGAFVASTCLYFWKKRKLDRLMEIFTLICRRDFRTSNLAIVELNERIWRIDDENEKLKDAIIEIETFGTNYNQMTREQQMKLGAYVHLMRASMALLTNPILGLQPKFSVRDFDKVYFDKVYKDEPGEIRRYFTCNKDVIIKLANLLFNITLNRDDIELLAEHFKKDKAFLDSINMTETTFDVKMISMAVRCLEWQYV